MAMKDVTSTRFPQSLAGIGEAEIGKRSVAGAHVYGVHRGCDQGYVVDNPDFHANPIMGLNLEAPNFDIAALILGRLNSAIKLSEAVNQAVHDAKLEFSGVCDVLYDDLLELEQLQDLLTRKLYAQQGGGHE